MIEDILKKIGLSTNSQNVYISLIKQGEMSVKVISQKTGLPRTTVYDALYPLINMGLVILKDEDGKSIYSVGDPNAIELVLDEQISVLQKTKKDVESIVNVFNQKKSVVEPKIRFFSGNEGVKKILNDILWYKNIETYTVWPMQEMIRLLGSEYLEWHNTRRVQRNIELKSLRVNKEQINFKKYPYLSGIEANLRKVKYTPANIKIKMSYWIYADKVAFVSTGAVPFGFIMHSQEFADMMLINFELLWEKSKDKL